MTKKEFKEAMLRGLGRCVIAVRKEPEKYRDIVLWGCKRDFAYDSQSEGSRVWYVYTMVNAYSDREIFISAAVEALRKYRPRGGWDLLHLGELLSYFAQDGYESARQALEEKYRQILVSMFARQRRPGRVFHELSDLEHLALVMATDRKTFLRVAGDLGRLYREKNYLYDGDFSWFFASEGRRYKSSMEAAARRDENIACFLRREQAYIDLREKQWQQRKEKDDKNRTGLRLSRWLRKKADKETIERYAAAYREQTLPDLRAEALMAFTSCPYPGDPQLLIGDALSEHTELRRVAWWALENIRHPSVRAFAHHNAEKGDRTAENFALLVTNYTPEDAALLESLLLERIAQKDWDAVHGAGMDVCRAFHDDIAIPHPKHLLPLLYEYTPCSFCRESAFVYLSRHRMLTGEMLEECLFDCNDHIRKKAGKRLKR